MGWWEVKNSDDVLGDGPADTMSEALGKIRDSNGSRPLLEHVLRAALAALQMNRTALLLDPEPPVTGLTAELKDGSKVAVSFSAANREWIKTLYQAFEDVAADYGEMEDHRKPRLSELLATLSFITRRDDQDLIETPNEKSISRITADRRPH